MAPPKKDTEALTLRLSKDMLKMIKILMLNSMQQKQ